MFFQMVVLFLRRFGLWMSSFLLVTFPYLLWIFVAGEAPRLLPGALVAIATLGVWSFLSTNSIAFPVSRSITGMSAPYIGSAGIGVFLIQAALHIGVVVAAGIGSVWEPGFATSLAVLIFGLLAVLFSEVVLWNGEGAYEKIEALRRSC